MGTLTVSSETAFSQSAEELYDFVTDPRNWMKVYPGSERIQGVETLPLQIGDTWHEGAAEVSRGRWTWRLITAVRPIRWVFQSVGGLGHNPADNSGGLEGIMTVSYSFLSPGQGVTLFHRTMSIEVAKGVPLPEGTLRSFDPKNIDAYHAAVARVLDGSR
jgi:Polyketide cyclase / dehydrase and lipid transport